MIKWREKFEHGLGVIQKGLSVYSTVKGVYDAARVIAPAVAAIL